MATLDQLRGIALALPEAYEKEAWGTPAFYVRKKLFARIREDGFSLALWASEMDSAALPTMQPEVFCIPEHYVNSSMFVINLHNIEPGELAEFLVEAWRMRAPKRLLATFDAAREPS